MNGIRTSRKKEAGLDSARKEHSSEQNGVKDKTNKLYWPRMAQCGRASQGRADLVQGCFSFDLFYPAEGLICSTFAITSQNSEKNSEEFEDV